MFMKNCLRKNTAKGVMNMVGRATPRSESTRWSCLTKTKFGSNVKIWGTMRTPRKTPKMRSRPFQRSRAKEQAAMAEKKT